MSRGKHGYGRQYRLTVPPELIGAECLPEYWERLAKENESQLDMIRENEYSARYGEMQKNERTNCRIRAFHARNVWKDFVDL